MSFAAFAAQELNQLADRLAAAAAYEAETAVRQATAKLQPTIDDLRAEQERLEHETSALRAEHERLSAEADALRSEHTEAEAALARLQQELAQARDAGARAQEEHAQATAAQAEALEEQTRLQSAFAEVAAERDQLKTQIAELDAERQRIDAERSELASTSRELTEERAGIDQALQQTRGLLEAARAEAQRLSDELEQHAADNAALAAAADSARGGQRGPLLAAMQSAFERVVRSASIDEVLAAVADGLSGDFSRVAVFGIHDNRLEPGYHYGFDANSGIGKVLVPLTVDSLFTQAIAADSVHPFTADAVADAGVPLGGSPDFVVAAPIKVRGDVIAVIYADDSGMSVAGNADDRMRLADLLRQCAVLRLERLTIELKMLGELRAYAKMLLDEVEYVYASDLNAGKSEAERQARMQENLRCARQIYQQRVAVEGPAAASLLDEQIAAAAAAKSETPYGRDLAFVAAFVDAGESTHAAQAS